jgi:hypothetical protein
MTPGFMRAPVWTLEEMDTLASMSDAGLFAADIAAALDRSVSAVRSRATLLGIRISRPRVMRPLPPGDREEWSEAQRLSVFADIPLPLAEMVVEAAEDAKLTLRQFRSECRLGKYVEARRKLCIRARGCNYSLPQIGRALNRDHTTVLHLLRCLPRKKYTRSHKPVDGIATQSPLDRRLAA